MLGLNDPHIARREIERVRLVGQLLPGHAKGDGSYVLARAPDIIVLGPPHGIAAERPPRFLSDLEIASDPEFREHYRKRVAEIPVPDLPGRERYRATRSGVLRFTYYERVRSGRGGSPREGAARD